MSVSACVCVCVRAWICMYIRPCLQGRRQYICAQVCNDEDCIIRVYNDEDCIKRVCNDEDVNDEDCITRFCNDEDCITCMQ